MSAPGTETSTSSASDAALLLYDYEEGLNNRQWQQSAGCLSHDGATYYFPTHGVEGDGRLYAISTSDGSLKWSVETEARGWEVKGSSPVVTTNGVVIVGNDDGDRYFAIRDNGTVGTTLDFLDVNPDGWVTGHARSTATISSLALALGPAWPNPANGGTTMRFALPVRADVRLEIYDLSGRLVRRLVDGCMDLHSGPRDFRGARLLDGRHSPFQDGSSLVAYWKTIRFPSKETPTVGRGPDARGPAWQISIPNSRCARWSRASSWGA